MRDSSPNSSYNKTIVRVSAVKPRVRSPFQSRCFPDGSPNSACTKGFLLLVYRLKYGFQDLPSRPGCLDLPRLAYPYWLRFEDLPSRPGCLDLPILAYPLLARIPGFALPAWLLRLA